MLGESMQGRHGQSPEVARTSAPDNVARIVPADLGATLRSQLTSECAAMAEYAIANGANLSPDTIAILKKVAGECPASRALAGDGMAPPASLSEMLRLHAQLATLVAPAKPRTLRSQMEDRARHPILHAFGHCDLMRSFMAVAAASLVVMLTISLFPEVNGAEESFSLARNAGAHLLINESFLLSAASLGAAFAALFRLHRYQVEGTYDRKYDSDYWSKYILGLIAGTILALVIPLHALAGKQATAGTVTFGEMARPMLALLGGFSSSLVYRLLNRLVLAFETILRGDARSEVSQQHATERLHATQSAAREKQRWTMQVLKALKQLHAGEDSGLIRSDLESLLGMFWEGSVGEETLPEASVHVPAGSPLANPAGTVADAGHSEFGR